jgi:hypothetical protein
VRVLLIAKFVTCFDRKKPEEVTAHDCESTRFYWEIQDNWQPSASSLIMVRQIIRQNASYRGMLVA